MQMPRKPLPPAPIEEVLDRTRRLAREVRQTAERVHDQAEEAHRLTEVARRAASRGRELSRQSRREADAVRDRIWQIDLAANRGKG